MPELPEVETMCRGIQGVSGSIITSARRAACRLKPIRLLPSPRKLAAAVVGRRVDSVTRVGKRCVLVLDNDQRVVFEPRMTGLVLVTAPPNRTHLRYQLELDRGPHQHLLFWDRRGLGGILLLSPQEFAEQLGPDRLGPDPLNVRLGEFRRRLAGSQRAVKVALLDQRVIAGIGNLYASEILHVAQVHPERSCRSLTAAEWRRCHRAMQRVLAEAIRYEGSTLNDGTYRNALNEAGTYQNHHRVYDRAGLACPRCRGGEVRRIVQAQRSTFFCPDCQA